MVTYGGMSNLVEKGWDRVGKKNLHLGQILLRTGTFPVVIDANQNLRVLVKYNIMRSLGPDTNWVSPRGLFKAYLWNDSVKCFQLSLGSPAGNTLLLRSRILTICSLRALWPPFKSLKHPTFLQVLSHVLKWRSAANKNRNWETGRKTNEIERRWQRH